MTRCLTFEDIQEYFDSVRSSIRFRSHLSECEACRELIASFYRSVSDKPVDSLPDDASPLSESDTAALAPGGGNVKVTRHILPVVDLSTRPLGKGLVSLCRPRGLERECQVELRWNGRTYLARADHYFRALTDLRTELRKGGLDVLCNGSLVNCFVSGMAATSASGLKAYLLREGRPASFGDIVATFHAPSGEYTVGSPEEQARFFERYLLSLAK